mmetsp:Transcript_588/g.1170  ORF Transcript_588/g.1170 Transcript_588/m.1170 type:complete len:275 (-) Transcript_588:23-847(-)
MTLVVESPDLRWLWLSFSRIHGLLCWACGAFLYTKAAEPRMGNFSRKFMTADMRLAKRFTHGAVIHSLPSSLQVLSHPNHLVSLEVFRHILSEVCLDPVTLARFWNLVLCQGPMFGNLTGTCALPMPLPTAAPVLRRLRRGQDDIVLNASPEHPPMLTQFPSPSRRAHRGCGIGTLFDTSEIQACSFQGSAIIAEASVNSWCGPCLLWLTRRAATCSGRHHADERKLSQCKPTSCCRLNQVPQLQQQWLEQRPQQWLQQPRGHLPRHVSPHQLP